MRFSCPLLAKILLWFFFNLLVLAAALITLFNLQFHLNLDSPVIGGPINRMEMVAHQIADELRGLPSTEWNGVLNRYAEFYGVELRLFNAQGEQLAGARLFVPSQVTEQIREHSAPPLSPPWLYRGRRRGGSGVFTLSTSSPSRYWMGVRVPLLKDGVGVRGVLLASSDSITGNGFFFDPRPLLITFAIIFGLSCLLWLPFARSLTRAIKQMQRATEQIADEQFEVRVDESRRDELGQLGHCINQLAKRLSGFVTGQKRFLGDISHEINSPLGRLQVALSILEERVDASQRPYVEDAQEEVRLMAELVAELLLYAKAGMRPAEIALQPVPLEPLVRRVIEREATSEAAFEIDIPDHLMAQGRPELLMRALANLVRNAVRYAASAGTIRVAAVREGERVVVRISDSGSGVPDEALEHLFSPFYRLEADRGRATGGTGLGLAIVKTCVEACGGSVTARNLSPKGFQVSITLRA